MRLFNDLTDIDVYCAKLKDLPARLANSDPRVNIPAEREFSKACAAPNFAAAIMAGARRVGVARNILAEHADQLNAWETRFLIGIQTYGILSPKQQAKLDAIVVKVAMPRRAGQ